MKTNSTITTNLKKTWSDLSESERNIEIKRLVCSRNMRLVNIIFERVISSSDVDVLDWFENVTDSLIQSTDDNCYPIINHTDNE